MTNTVAGIAPGHEHRRLADRRRQARRLDDEVPGDATWSWLQSGRHGTQVFPEAWNED